MRTIALLLSLASAARAEIGATGGATLGRPIGTRALSMGEAFTAVEGELDSVGYNPAGAARMVKRNLQTQYTNGIAEDHFMAATYGHPLSFGTVWGGLAYYDAGTVVLQFADGSTSKVKAQQDFVGSAGAAFTLARNITVGGQGKFYRFRLADQVTASGMAVDLGAQARLPLDGLTVGASARNLGPDVKYEQEGDPLPMEARFGAAYLLDLYKLDLVRNPENAMSQFLFSVDGVQRRNEEPWAALGVEMRMPLTSGSFAAIRLGYKLNRPLDAPSIGLGLRERRVFFDYGFGAQRAVRSVHHFTVGWLF